MDSAKFKDDLWEEIPDYAYIALGRRGREKIMLHECFVHGCGIKDETLLHPLQKTETVEKSTTESSNPTGVLLRKYLIYCEQGDHSFHLVFERHGLLANPDALDDQDLDEEDILFERVYATDEADQKTSERSVMSNFAENISQFSCILFDLDNTLLGIPETWKYFDDLIQEVLRTEFHFVTVPDRDTRNTLWRSGKEYIKILHDWGIADPDEFWRVFDRRDGVKRKKLIANQELILYDDVIPTLQKLRANPTLKLGIVTNSPNFIADYELDAYGLSGFFDAVLGLGDDQTICKPEPTGILMMMETLQATPEETLYIGDSMIDMLAADRAGIHSMLIHRKNKQRHLSDPLIKAENQNFMQITHLDEILPYVIM